MRIIDRPLSGMKTGAIFLTAAIISFLSPVTATQATLAGGKPDFFSYQVIIDRKPFGEPPPEAPAPGAGQMPGPPPPPPFVRELRMCAIADSPAGTRVGFVDIRAQPPKTYYLYVGEREDGIEVVKADFEKEGALLRKGAEEHWLYMSGETGEAAQQAMGAAPPAAGTPPATTERIPYADRLRRRREALEERRRQALEQKPKFSGEELRKHLEEYQMEVIRKGLPPLPIPLTPEMDRQLVEEGVLPPLEQ